MRSAAQKVTTRLLRAGFIEQGQFEWCSYIVESRLVTFISLFLLIGIGALAFPFSNVLTLNIGILWLRPKTNGFHAKTFLGCLCLSLFFELSALALLPLLNGVGAWVALLGSGFLIFVLGPFNNQEIHFTASEMRVLRKKMLFSLFSLAVAAAILLFIFPNPGRCLVMSMNVTAFLLILAKLGLGVQ